VKRDRSFPARLDAAQALRRLGDEARFAERGRVRDKTVLENQPVKAAASHATARAVAHATEMRFRLLPVGGSLTVSAPTHFRKAWPTSC
jgi:hypothetical protein